VVVKQNQTEKLIKGNTLIKFEAHITVFSILVILIGIMWGIGKAAVYKHIPEYFPNEVGVVGGMVGLIGGLGGFIGPILFGYLLDFSGLWTSSWIFCIHSFRHCLVLDEQRHQKNDAQRSSAH
jgi:NNP family nitrate/nitrite transporter-like MFS transporter